MEGLEENNSFKYANFGGFSGHSGSFMEDIEETNQNENLDMSHDEELNELIRSLLKFLAVKK